MIVNRRPARPWETSYNGWDWKARCAITPMQNAMFKAGQLIRPSVCSICGFSDPAHFNGSGYIFAHTEMYDRPDVLFPACKRCHSDLHARFRDPERWLRRLECVEVRSEWPRLLTLDPASQWRRFAESYPNGLPLPCVLPDQPDLFRR